MIPLATAMLAVALGAGQSQDEKTGGDAHLSRATQLVREQLYEAAAGEYEAALTSRTNDPRIHLQYAVCLLNLGRNEEARKEFEKVREMAGESRYVTYYLGRIDLLANDYESAIKRLGSVAANPPFPDTAFHLGVAYASSGNDKAAMQWLEQAAKVLPRDYRVHYRLARAYASAGREVDAGREYASYERLRNEQKATEEVVRACSDALHRSPSANAREICHRIYDPNDSEKLTLLGQLFGDSGAPEDALEPLSRAAQLDPKSFEAWQDLGLAYFRLQRYAEARVPLEKAVALRPEFYGSVVLLGGTLYMLGDDEAALPVLEHALRLKPTDSETAAVVEKLRAAQKKQ